MPKMDDGVTAAANNVRRRRKKENNLLTKEPPSTSETNKRTTKKRGPKNKAEEALDQADQIIQRPLPFFFFHCGLSLLLSLPLKAARVSYSGPVC